MKRLKDYMPFLGKEITFVQELLLQWTPPHDAESEKDFEQHLFQWLTATLPQVPIVTQYGIAKGKADIVIQDSHVIELKLGLMDVYEFDRCIGQLERYRQKWCCNDRGPVYLIVVGESDSEFRDVLGKWLTQANENTSLPSFWGQAFSWIEKTVTPKSLQTAAI